MPKTIKVEPSEHLFNRLQFVSQKVTTLGAIIQNGPYHVPIDEVINWGDMAGKVISDLEGLCDEIAEHLGKHA